MQPLMACICLNRGYRALAATLGLPMPILPISSGRCLSSVWSSLASTVRARFVEARARGQGEEAGQEAGRCCEHSGIQRALSLWTRGRS